MTCDTGGRAGGGGGMLPVKQGEVRVACDTSGRGGGGGVVEKRFDTMEGLLGCYLSCLLTKLMTFSTVRHL